MGGQYIPDLTERFPEGFGGVDLTDSYFPSFHRSDPYRYIDEDLIGYNDLPDEVEESEDMSKNMNVDDRKKMVAAMEYIARCINDESIFMTWLSLGVADEDIPLGKLDPDFVDDFYIEDEEFAYLMNLFLKLMERAKNSGGLYHDGICNKDE